MTSAVRHLQGRGPPSAERHADRDDRSQDGLDVGYTSLMMARKGGREASVLPELIIM